MTVQQKLAAVPRLSTIANSRFTHAVFSCSAVKYLVVAAILLVGASLVALFPVIQTTRAAESAALSPVLVNYPNTTVALSGNAEVTPEAVLTGVTDIEVSTNTNFKGSFTADPMTGLVRVTNAHPEGAYTVAVQVSVSGGAIATSSFILTVQQGMVCEKDSFFTNAVDVGGSNSNQFTRKSIAIGDFNNDGKQDLAVTNYSSADLSIRLGDGQGGFIDQPNVSVGSRASSVAIGDFNQDGKQDLIVSRISTSNVSIRFGDGLGGFSGTTSVNVSSNPTSVAIGDFNKDGKQDFLSAGNFSSSVSVRLGDGLGGFSGTTNVTVGSYPMDVTIGDFNNDDNQDFASTGSGGVSIRLGDGLGGFSGSTNVTAGPHPGSIAIGDFNKDGKQDFATSNLASNIVSIRLGDGLGSFFHTPDVSVGEGPASVAIGDFNNDGNQDFVVANRVLNNVSVYLGNGLGTFSATTNVHVGTDPGSVAIGDFDEDGKQDFATANSGNISIRLGSCARVIIFEALSDKTYGDADFTISAIASSGLPVKFAASGNCTVNVNTVHLNGAGECTITASQPGDADHLALPDVKRTFKILRATATTTVICPIKVTYTGLPLRPCSAIATGVDGFKQDLVVDYLDNTNSGTAIASASFGGDANHTGYGLWQAFSIDKASQTITFDDLPKKTVGDPDFDVRATSSSGLAVSFKALGNCTINGVRVRLTGAGSCTITASQVGDSNYNAAISIARTFSIDPPGGSRPLR